ncbi:hypothetical protein Q8A67_019849 [Cirrhinus molitorella]|uniref:Uncharacterized protein n=1 Tax=Cirrhinus molitorella TaxID=172907 RepID=A0AA88TQ35_9TELE|nr:hypothetical protein Q8A67_019849 [Cirrhinus molitorella]
MPRSEHLEACLLLELLDVHQWLSLVITAQHFLSGAFSTLNDPALRSDTGFEKNKRCCVIFSPVCHQSSGPAAASRRGRGRLHPEGRKRGLWRSPEPVGRGGERGLNDKGGSDTDGYMLTKPRRKSYRQPDVYKTNPRQLIREFISGQDVCLCRPEDTPRALSVNPRGYQFTWFPIETI